MALASGLLLRMQIGFSQNIEDLYKSDNL